MSETRDGVKLEYSHGMWVAELWHLSQAAFEAPFALQLLAELLESMAHDERMLWHESALAEMAKAAKTARAWARELDS